MKLTQDGSRKRRAYELKFRIIPNQQEKLRGLQAAQKEVLKRLRIEKNELNNIESDFNREFGKNEFLESLKIDNSTHNIAGLKIPKSIGGHGK